MKTEEKTFHAPVRPYTPIDALNRRAAAVGSPGYAFACKTANYNGHHVTVSWNSYRGYYIAEYFWAGRVVLARGDFARCLAAAFEEYNRGAVGSSIQVTPRMDDAEALDLAEAYAAPDRDPVLRRGRANFTPEWYSWKHKAAAQSARDAAHPRAAVRVFDWELMQGAESLEAYEAAVKAKHGRVWMT